MTGLTEKQAELLAFIARYATENDHAPTFAAMADGVGLKSKSGIDRLLRALEERGHIRRLRNRNRTVEIIRRRKQGGPQLPGPAQLAECTDAELTWLRRDLAMEITKRTNVKAIARADAIMAREGA